MSDPTPCLRPEIDVHPIRHEGKTFFVLYDTSGLSKAQLAISPVVLFIATQLDGATSVLDIRTGLAEQVEEAPPVEEIASVLEAFDEALFLQGERFDRVREEIRREFLESDARPAGGAGTAYPEEPGKLAESLDAMIAAAPHPEEEIAVPPGSPPPRGAILPHIDFVRGGAGYGQAYRLLRACEPPDIAVVLGTGHQPMQNRVALCDKDFDVPGGRIRNARDATEALRTACREIADFSDDAFAHQGEHSVELQAVWLRHVWGDRVRIVPVLVGSMQPFLQPNASGGAADDPQLAAFANALRELAESDHRVMLLASADLAHIGPRFGDEREVAGEFLAEVEEADRAYLAAVSSGDPAAGLEALARHGDRYHVCGAGCIHMLNAALPGVRGTLLGYHQAATPEMQQAVTYAAALFA